MVVLLINTIIVNASGITFFDNFTKWGINAIYSLFGFERDTEITMVDGEIQPLQNKLDELRIAASLPKSILQGYRFFEVTLATAEEPYMLNTWFQNFGTQKSISLVVDGSSQDGPGSWAEVSETEEFEPIEHEGVTYKVYMNHDRILVIWKDGI
jgi:hypothetical protein